jgi:hypothetical protein
MGPFSHKSYWALVLNKYHLPTQKIFRRILAQKPLAKQLCFRIRCDLIFLEKCWRHPKNILFKVKSSLKKLGGV